MFCRSKVLLIGLIISALTVDVSHAQEDATTSLWVKTMCQAQTAYLALDSAPAEPLYKSPPIAYGEKGKEVDVDVAGLQYLWLVVGDGGNGTGCDHSVWGNARVIDANGKETLLGSMTPVAAIAGWKHLQVDKNASRRRLSIGGNAFPHGLWTHSKSFICYALHGKYRTFKSTVGIDDGACSHGKATFEVRCRVPKTDALAAIWRNMERAFPDQAAWFAEDMPDEKYLEWFRNLQVQESSNLLLQRICDVLGGSALPFENARKQLAADADDTAAILGIYLQARQRLADIRELRKTLEFCRDTLTMVEETAPRPQFHAPLNTLAKRVEEAADTPDSDLAAVADDIGKLRRKIVLSHPLLDFDTLLINKRPPPGYIHQCDQYLGRHSRTGPGLVLLKSWKNNPTEKALLENRLPEGTVTHPDLSFDAKKILFSYCDHTLEPKEHRRFCIYEINIDGTGLRQLTGTTADPMQGAEGRQSVLIEDFDPCYLPDGDIIFVSTRNQTFGRCHLRRYNPSFLLYRMHSDGSGIRQLSFGEANEWDPCVLSDGRIIYTRWDYINRHDVLYQSLWTMHPDGTGTAHYYGNYSANPCMTAEARGIPDTRTVVCTAMAHHAYTAGSIITVDPDKGQDGPEPITRLTPQIPFPETEGWNLPSSAAAPWPLSKDLYLVAYNPIGYPRSPLSKNENAYGIYLLDRLGGMEEIYTDPDVSCFAPIPVVPRDCPPALPSVCSEDPTSREGILYVQNVNVSTQPLTEEKITKLRINKIIGQPTAGVNHRGKVRQEIVKRIVGTVPVSSSGRACFSAPAGVPLQLQALNEENMAVLTMRSFIYLQPGETISCIGCHEQRALSPVNYGPDKFTRIDRPVPPVGPKYEGGFSFPCTVQPVLDRYCISCHGLKRTAAKLSLIGAPVSFPSDGYPLWPREVHASESYQNLVERDGWVKIAQRNRETVSSKPRDYFAHAGKLADFLLKGHCPELVKDRESLQRIIDWLDLNAQYNGNYSFNRLEERKPSKEGEKALRKFLKTHAGEEWSEQPFAALVNVALPEQSRALKALLSTEAGGWAGKDKAVWKNTSDPAYRELVSLVNASIQPLATHDLAGTCNQTPCTCGCCWVREAEAEWRKRTAKP